VDFSLFKEKAYATPQKAFCGSEAERLKYGVPVGRERKSRPAGEVMEFDGILRAVREKKSRKIRKFERNHGRPGLFYSRAGLLPKNPPFGGGASGVVKFG
jgi:hypothetical protein